MKKLMVLSATAAALLSASAKIEMGAPFADGAVLQRGMKVPVWGTLNEIHSLPSRVTVSFAGQTKTVRPDTYGRWQVELEPLATSAEGRTMTVVEEADDWFARLFSKPRDTVELKDILVGEVWFASGQSNMECPIWGGNTRYRDMKGGLMTTMTELPLVRYVKMNHRWSTEPAPIRARWRTLTSANLTQVQFSAVAFYYARELHLALGIPVGILDASWGGTNIDAWTPRCGYEGCDPSIQATADYVVKADWKAETDKKGPIGGAHQQPTVLWNGMVGAFAPMAMRGFIWYQGCHNSGESHLYAAKMHALYSGWSRAFRNPDLKLYFVELAPYNQNWLGICAAQDRFVAEEKNAALAVTADVGNFDDIHPNDKEIVAKRLAVHALKRDYGFAIPEDCSPVFKSVAFADGQATLAFDHVKNWYVYAPNRSRAAAFELAGADGVWQPAKIVNSRPGKDKNGNKTDTDYIDGAAIVLKSDAVAAPVKVRYLGQPRTSGTMYNEASLPLGAFETK